MRGKILGLSGKKQSGKDSFYKYFHDKYPLDSKKFSFADSLKSVCADLLNLDLDKMYGSEEDKNSTTQYKWQDWPTWEIIQSKKERELMGKYSSFLTDIDECNKFAEEMRNYKNGFMTYREVLQQFGTNIVRQINYDAWVNMTFARIRNCEDDHPTMVYIIPDARFPNEVNAIQKIGGKVFRLNRSVDNDTHPSETALDSYDKFDHIVNNKDMTLIEANQYIEKLVKDWLKTDNHISS